MNSEVTALLLGGLDGVELIEAIYLHVFEGYLAALVATYQFVIHAQWSTAGGKTKCEESLAVLGLVFGDSFDNLRYDVFNAIAFDLENRCGDLLETMDDILRCSLQSKTAILW